MKILQLLSFLLFINLLSAQTNLALMGNASQSSDYNATQGLANLANDGNTDGDWANGSVTHTQTESSAWWQVDLLNGTALSHVKLYNRLDCCSNRLSNFYIFVSGADFTTNNLDDLLADVSIYKVYVEQLNANSIAVPINFAGRFVRIQLSNSNPLSLAEVEVFQLIGSQLYQTVDFALNDKYLSTEDPFELSGTSSSGLPVSYEIISGPATIIGNTVTLTGAGGELVIGAYQEGNNNFGPSDTILRTTQIIDPLTVFPTINISTVTEDFDVVMPTLKALDIYANAIIDHPEYFNIDEISFEINGTPVQGVRQQEGFYYFTFSPSQYGFQTLTATATGSNGVSASTVQEFNVVDQVSGDYTVMAIENAEIIWPSTPFHVYQTINLPTQLDSYNAIQGHLFVDCPDNANCDPWDRILKISVRKPGGPWYEILRYISPYFSVCDHYIDLSDYLNLLQGEVEFDIYYATYSDGRRIDLELTYSAGPPDYSYYNVDKLWSNTLDFGNPANLQPADTINFKPHENAQALKLKLVSTGHGWGENNTGNAAEFRNSIHTLFVNDQDYVHHPWMICNPNPDGCQPQSGTWTYARAGWCPGAISHGDEYNLTEFLMEDNIDFWLRLDESYTDFCHPNNPDCISGSTCMDCNAGFNPHYVMLSNLITKSSQLMSYDEVIEIVSIDEPIEIEVAIYPNPVSEILNLYYNGNINNLEYALCDLNGKKLKIGRFTNTTQQIDISDLANGVYVLNVESNHELMLSKRVVKNNP